MVYSSERNVRVFWVAAFLLWFAGSAAWAQSQSDIMSIKDVKVGMKGIGKTVIRGRDIETFNVEVLGILSNNKINENLQINGSSILVRVSGKVIDEAGGIAAGMSGSPIFVNGKLIGGLSSGWVMTDHTVGLVTPIEEMLEIWDYPLSASLPKKSEAPYWKNIDGKAIQIGGNSFQGIHQTSNDEEAMELAKSSQDAVFVEVAAPIVVQGLYDRAASMLKRKLGGKNVEVVAGAPGLSAESSGTGNIEPGSAIGIQLARGDVNLTTLGTLTYRDGKRILGFAHPFLKKGSASFLMTGAHIHHSFSSVQMPFKVGAPTEMIGVITQDREKGVAGELGRFPTLVPVQIEVADRDLKRSRTINYQVVQDEGVFQSVIESTLLQAIEGVIDRNGEGTALLGIALDCVGSSGAKYTLRRENLFYSKTDITNTLIDAILDVISIVQDCDLEEVRPVKLMIKVDLEKRRRTQTIEKVEIKNTSITPGGMLEVWVTIRPFRDKPVVRKARLPLPANISKENLRLTVHGLGSRGVETDESETSDTKGTKGKEAKKDEPTHESFNMLAASWMNKPRNSDLIFQLSSETDAEKKFKISGKDFETMATNLVVIGSIDTTIALSEE